MAWQCVRKTVGFLLLVWVISVALTAGGGCSDEDQTGKTDLSTDDSSQVEQTELQSKQFPKIVKVGLETYEPADNTGCQVCHIDFEEETLSVKHVEAGVGCNDCHGPSEDHSQDELNILYPDYLFGRGEVVSFCKTCHQEEHPKGKMYELFMKKWLGKYRPNGRMIRADSVCTDCHGNHARIPADKMHFPTE